MDAKLHARCERQLTNEDALRRISTVAAEESIKIGSLLYTALGVTDDDEKIDACRKILAGKQAFFANLQGVLHSLLLLKMALAEDPEAYIDGVIDVHDKLTEGLAPASLFTILTAVIIFDEHGKKDINEVVPTVKQMFAEVQAYNAPLSNDLDMAYIALMLLSGKANKSIEDEKEEIFKALHDKFQLSLDASQATTLVLITSNKSAEEKVNQLAEFYEDLRETGHATSAKRSISIYGAFTDVDVDRAKMVQDIVDVDKFLKGKKGYGAFSISADFRRIMAAMLVLQYYTIDLPAESGEDQDVYRMSTGISLEALLFIVLMSILAM